MQTRSAPRALLLATTVLAVAAPVAAPPGCPGGDNSDVVISLR